MSCINFIAEIKSFKEKVQATQETLLNVTPDTETLPPIQDVFKVEEVVVEVDAPEPTPAKRKRGRPPTKVKKEEEEDLTTTPTRRTSRVRKEREVPEDVVTEFHDSDDHHVDVDTSDEDDDVDLKLDEAELMRRQRKKAQKEKEEQPYLSHEDAKRERKQRKLDESALVDYDGASDDDRLNRKEDRMKAMASNRRQSNEVQEQKRKAYKRILTKRFVEFAHLDERCRDLGMFVCSVCQVDKGCFAELFVHMEREHDILRYNAYAVCCKKRFSSYTVYDHLKYHDDQEAFKCPQCPKRCMSTQNLRKHMIKHKPDSERKHRCGKCGKGYYVKAEFSRHMRKHQIYRHNCGECRESE